MKKYILGLDTSCYTTSMALVDMNGNTILNRQIPLDVEAGERGLQQSKALFQHLHRLPAITEELGKAIDPKRLSCCLCYQPSQAGCGFVHAGFYGIAYGWTGFCQFTGCSIL